MGKKETRVSNREDTEVRLTILFGILQQLMTTRQNKLFAKLELTLSQFGLLIHFTHNPNRSWLVTELAEVMEMNQPGITKIASQLIEKNLLIATADTKDKRKKHLKISDKGLKACSSTMAAFSPDIQNIYSAFEDEELGDLSQHLEKLMSWLDSNRDNIKGL